MATQFDPNKAQNAVEIEKQFAVTAVEHAQVYWNLLESVDPRSLKLTKLDDEIFDQLKEVFPEMFVEPYKGLVKLDENAMKSSEGKKKWRSFITPYEGKIKDFNFGSLIRTDAEDEYGQDNSIFVTRMQFYGIEIARNRLGLNDAIHIKAKKEAEKAKAKKDQEKVRGKRKA